MNTENEIIKREIKDHIIELVRSNRLEEAKLLVEEYDSRIPNDSEIYLILANIYVAENNIDEGEKILREILKVEFNNGEAMYNLAWIYENTKLKCLTLALNYYKRSLEIIEDENLKEEIKFSIHRIENQLVTFDEEKKPLVSIVVLAYNHSDYTKKCIDSIYKYTSHINFELITVNNGSSDDTEKYFNSLPNSKKIHIVNNVGPVDGFNAGIEWAEGKYTAAIGNDFILTPNWLDNLLTCIESDESIGFVSPGANTVSNFQQISCSYKSANEMQAFAKKYNVSDPKKWEERVRLLPCVLLCKSKFLKSICGYDPRFYYGEYADDDISIRIRRSGYKLIYAGDTFVHHGGSITTEKEHIENNSLGVSREIFIRKYNMDNWAEITFNPEMLAMINYKYKENATILGINTFCGGTPLQVKNKLKSIGVQSIKITSVNENDKYMEDLKTISDEVYYSSIDKLKDFISDSKFDFIIYEAGIDYVKNINLMFDILKSCLNKDGQLIFSINNKAYYKNLFYIESYEQNLYGDGYRVAHVDYNKVMELISSKGFSNVKTSRMVPLFHEDLVNNLVNSLVDGNKEVFKLNITTMKFIISCEL